MLEPSDFYTENGTMVFTESYHLKRGSCCGNGCRHCPYDHVAVPEREIPLLGGDVTDVVVRVGTTVRRTPSAQSAAVHAYLAHLARAGFSQAPRFLGIDERGREMLSYIEGETAGRPLQPWAADEDVLIAIARLQRRLHDCSAGFRLPPQAVWTKPLELEGVAPPYKAPDIVGHNDMTPENIVFADRLPVGLIDFDLAGPTTRLLDIVTTLLWWAPLRDPADRDPLLCGVNEGRRMRLYVDAYGLGEHDRGQLLDVAQVGGRRRRRDPARGCMARARAGHA